MKSLRVVQTFGVEQKNGRAQLRTAPCRVVSPDGFMNLPEFTQCGPGTLNELSKLDYSNVIPPQDKRVMQWIDHNCEFHAPFVNESTNLRTQGGKYHGKTVLFVLCGPSAKGIKERIAPWREHPDFYVATLNLAAQAVPDCDFFCNFEQLIPRNYFDHLDPERTTLLTCPMAGNPVPHEGHLAKKWGGRNVFYSYMGDMRAPLDARWEHLPMLFSAIHTGVAALQALYFMGFSNILVTGADYAMANPHMNPENPTQIVEAEWYFDGSKYRIDESNMGKCYYNGQPLVLSEGINGKMCATLPMLYKQAFCTKVVMEMIHEAGVECRNVSGQGVLDYNTSDLEEWLEQHLPLGVLQEAA